MYFLKITIYKKKIYKFPFKENNINNSNKNILHYNDKSFTKKKKENLVFCL